MKLYLLSLEEAALLPEVFCEKYFPKRLIRSRRFRRKEDALRSIGAGALTCGILNVHESEIRYGEFGKPFLSEMKKYFSLSHSGCYVLMAVSHTEIGVDIEKIDSHHLNIARRVFQQEEQEWMNEDPLQRFFVLWTLKESVMKFFGRGLNLPPSSFSVSGLIQNGTMTIFDQTLYAKSLIFEEHVLSVCSENPLDDLKPQIMKVEDLTEIKKKQES